MKLFRSPDVLAALDALVERAGRTGKSAGGSLFPAVLSGISADARLDVFQQLSCCCGTRGLLRGGVQVRTARTQILTAEEAWPVLAVVAREVDIPGLEAVGGVAHGADSTQNVRQVKKLRRGGSDVERGDDVEH